MHLLKIIFILCVFDLGAYAAERDDADRKRISLTPELEKREPAGGGTKDDEKRAYHFEIEFRERNSLKPKRKKLKLSDLPNLESSEESPRKSGSSSRSISPKTSAADMTESPSQKKSRQRKFVSEIPAAEAPKPSKTP